jgi:hypothetical protein
MHPLTPVRTTCKLTLSQLEDLTVRFPPIPDVQANVCFRPIADLCTSGGGLVR